MVEISSSLASSWVRRSSTPESFSHRSFSRLMRALTISSTFACCSGVNSMSAMLRLQFVYCGVKELVVLVSEVVLGAAFLVVAEVSLAPPPGRASVVEQHALISPYQVGSVLSSNHSPVLIREYVS